ncbi:dol-P-Man:Man(5)GlcNAc(2)-PP-Dol alpha-1,3-mannosyltransferase-like [Vigna angularis]|uniref:dol-P-Man:Man(5)GlcNAc(2)-PP-Dol alpha-1,3-mannosyltransferase-like n=1 Tax=Phaseolus angularis TaxID=3914 RepID=UPI0022B544DD|nr:dol-P-Man:Man(5)GlcNAc(2)-PP-Dol alpha-1,3-mannosyltransferase-like [Vigna angularis]
MGVESVAPSPPPPRSEGKTALLQSPKIPFSLALLFADVLLVTLADALFVSRFLKGERDFRNLKGDTGPLIYPAGFLYIYSAFEYLTQGQVYPAHVTHSNYSISHSTQLIWALCLLSLSKRVHSIFVLRLYNDCMAMTLLQARAPINCNLIH